VRQDEAGDLIVARSGALMEAPAGREMVGLDVGSGTCFGFNVTAHRIWQLIAQPVSLSQLCGALSKEFAVDPDIVARDVRTLLDELAADGLVTLSRPD